MYGKRHWGDTSCGPARFLKRHFKLPAFLTTLIILLSGCAGVPSVLTPSSPPARQVVTLWWVMFGLAMVVLLVVIGYIILIVRRKDREEGLLLPENDAQARAVVTWAGAIVPAIIVVGLMAYVTYVQSQTAAPAEPYELTVEVRSHDWWWEVMYPGYDFETANEIHIPVGKPVKVRLTSADVIHSFWVPELQGKTDMMPGTVTTTWLQADEPGVYPGQCAEFCGMQHAKMKFLVIAQEAQDFENWLEQQQAPAAQAEGEDHRQGQQVFLESECIFCHTVRGTNATGEVGPDLTHLASRREIGAGTLPNTRGFLAGWIVNAQQFKLGNRMPPMPMEGQDLQIMLDYLTGLE